ncbi:MAG: zincin-like metallopeptidase domain-containing protein [Candidatus Kapabacteria bacterium]|nr:zincin-like metallopeptidase domain-containing protein [Candidatus Kapabacteria bacterium]
MNFIYQKITDQILEQLKQNIVPWQKNWSSAFPENYISGLRYQGINTIMLGLSNFESHYWLTFRQCKALGGSVKKDEHASMVVFWKPIVRITGTELDESTADVHFLLKYYNVFNLQQVELPDEVLKKKNIMSSSPKIMEAEQIIQGYKNPPKIVFNNMIPNPRYIPSKDMIEILSIDKFHTPADYYSSLFHEMAHSSGAIHRLNRSGITDKIIFGSSSYGREELVAEITSQFLCNVSGINTNFENSVSYISNWLQVLQNDPKMIVIAASQAQKATAYILNHSSTNSLEE